MVARFAAAILTDGLGEDACTVARDDRNARVLLQPCSDGSGAAVGKQTDDTPAFQVAHDGAVAQPAPPCPLVDANHPRRGLGRQLGRTHQPQQRVAACRHREAGSQARAGLAA